MPGFLWMDGPVVGLGLIVSVLGSLDVRLVTTKVGLDLTTVGQTATVRSNRPPLVHVHFSHQVWSICATDPGRTPLISKQASPDGGQTQVSTQIRAGINRIRAGIGQIRPSVIRNRSSLSRLRPDVARTQLIIGAVSIGGMYSDSDSRLSHLVHRRSDAPRGSRRVRCARARNIVSTFALPRAQIWTKVVSTGAVFCEEVGYYDWARGVARLAQLCPRSCVA